MVITTTSNDKQDDSPTQLARLNDLDKNESNKLFVYNWFPLYTLCVFP